MDTRQLQKYLTAAFQRAERTSAILLSGPPGAGKNAIIGASTEAARLPLRVLALPTCEAIDLRGMPYIENGVTKWGFPLPREGRGVLVLDEAPSAAPDVQVAAHHVVWAEAGSDMSVGKGWHIVLTGNRAADKTLYRPLSGPLRNRITMVNVEVNPLHWADWAAKAGVSPLIVGFIRHMPQELTCKDVPADGAFPSPRSWHRASEDLSLAVSPDIEREVLVGNVGEASATKAMAYFEQARNLPAIESIYADPKRAPVPRDPSLAYALTASLAQYTNINGRGIMEYVSRLPAEFGVLYIRDIRDRYDLSADDNIREFVRKHKNLFLDE